MTVLSTSTTTPYTFPNDGEYLLVTGAGSIVEDLSDAYAVDSSGIADTITIDGLVYSVGSVNGNTDGGVGVYIAGTESNLLVNGQVLGDTGVEVYQTTNASITVGVQGSIDGLTQDGVMFEGNSTNPGLTNNSLNNAGDISSASSWAVLAENGGGDRINNSGQISGGVNFDLNVRTETVENSGTIAGGNGATIRSYESSAGVDIVNTGLLTNEATNVIGPVTALLYFHDDTGTASTIDNKGTITGPGYVIQSASDILDIANSGTIHGGLYSTASVAVDNAGLWKGQAGSAVVVFDLTHDDDVLTNARAGTIDDGITLASGGDTITNAGSIDGAIAFTGSGITNALTNSGAITGNIKFSSADSTLTNSDSITGDVAMVGSDNLINTGVIHGDVALGVSDIVELSVGEVTGAITGKTNDLFAFSGNFGHETIDKFIGGAGSTHDTIRFATNDFGSFAAVQSHMSQVGSDVVIRLDGTDTITLAGVKLSSLVSADFKFV